jgi:hypothetical protein
LRLPEFEGSVVWIPTEHLRGTVSDSIARTLTFGGGSACDVRGYVLGLEFELLFLGLGEVLAPSHHPVACTMISFPTISRGGNHRHERANARRNQRSTGCGRMTSLGAERGALEYRAGMARGRSSPEFDSKTAEWIWSVSPKEGGNCWPTVTSNPRAVNRCEADRGEKTERSWPQTQPLWSEFN